MAAGTPAVTTSAGGILEYAQDGDNALVVPVDNADELCDAILRLARDAELRARLRDGARRTALSLSWERIVERYIRLYRAVMP
jgi:glycosyltransferase involved in cell wall biosynthesis